MFYYLECLRSAEHIINGKGRMFKKAVQQGRALLATSGRASSLFGARSVPGVREYDKSPRTQLAAFFNIPKMNKGRWRSWCS